MTNRNDLDPNLPLGYRWASEEEVAATVFEPGLPFGFLMVPIVFGPDRMPLRKEDRTERRVARLDDRNLDLVREHLAAFDADQTKPRVGDFVEFADGVVRRFTHDWDEMGIQTTDERHGSQSFHLGDGYCSYSGSLRPPVMRETLTRKDETRPGWVWIWHHGWSGAHRGVDIKVPLRVYACSLSSEEN